jgi:asparagine synthase (glutamine-hydrolysing)
MIDEKSGSVIVYNGEIYNYRELRAGLESVGHRFKSQSDTEVLMTLFRVHGEAMLPMLNGIFAFAIYDSGENTVLLACDSMAIKPLYYAEGPDGFVFASELKALLACGAIDRTLDVASLFRTLGFLFSPGGATPFKSVRRFGPGEALRAKNGRIQRHWTWAETTWNSAPLRVDAPEAIDRVTGAVRTAVHRQMIADVPVGAFLSGGLDSGAVVAMAREVSPQIDCFTIDTGSNRDPGVTDDLPYAREVAKHLQLRLHEIQVDSARMAADLERMVFQLDEPLADPAPLNVMYISQLARQAGVKVLLSGAGGDDLFTGYRRHRAVMAEPYWTWLPKPMRAGLRAGSARLGSNNAVGRRVAKAFAHADWPPSRRMAGYFLWADPQRVLGLFAPELRATLAADMMTAPLENYLESLPHGLPPLQQMLSLEQRFYLPDHNLLYTDKMSMSAGVEVRVPFLDRDLVALANTLPVQFKQHGREGKWVLKKAMEPYLPRHVIYRPKTGFGAPLRHWLRHELRGLVDDLLSADTLRRRGLFDAKAVAQLVADDRAGRIDAAYTILGLLCIEIWCSKFAE